MLFSNEFVMLEDEESMKVFGCLSKSSRLCFIVCASVSRYFFSSVSFIL